MHKYVLSYYNRIIPILQKFERRANVILKNFFNISWMLWILRCLGRNPVSETLMSPSSDYITHKKKSLAKFWQFNPSMYRIFLRCSLHEILDKPQFYAIYDPNIAHILYLCLLYSIWILSFAKHSRSITLHGNSRF